MVIPRQQTPPENQLENLECMWTRYSVDENDDDDDGDVFVVVEIRSLYCRNIG